MTNMQLYARQHMKPLLQIPLTPTNHIPFQSSEVLDTSKNQNTPAKEPILHDR